MVMLENALPGVANLLIHCFHSPWHSFLVVEPPTLEFVLGRRSV